MQKTVLFLVLLALALPASAAGEAASELSPKQAWAGMQKELAAARRSRNYNLYRQIQQSRPKEFLAAWDKSGRKAEGEELFYLAEFYGAASRWGEARAAYRTCAADAKLTESTVNSARLGFARALLGALYDGSLKGKEADEALTLGERYLAELAEGGQTGLVAGFHGTLARCYGALDRKAPALQHYLDAARTNPAMAYGSARSAISALMSGVHDLAAYDGLRKEGKKLVEEFTELQKRYIAKLREAGQESQLPGAEASLKRIAGMMRPLEMLGRPAPDWTLEKAWGDVKSLGDVKGKVVMVDFWATWCGWCIRSFPALRDLLRDYQGKDFVIVGVTAPARYVTSHRYDLDADLAEKAKTAGPPETVRLPRDGTPEQISAFRVKEKEILGKFIANHEMTWPVLMIAADEPSRKYALTGWPHGMILDRQGRVRYFKRGALLRDRPEQVKKFRDLIDALLAEKDEKKN